MSSSSLTKFLGHLFDHKDEENLPALYDAAPQSFSNEYPEVPEPESELSPLLIAARWAAGDIYGEDMPQVAADLLEAGHDTPSLRRLAGETQIGCSDDVEPLVAATLRELGIDYPMNEKQAKLICIRNIAREVIAGLRNPWKAASYIEIVVCNRIPFTDELDALLLVNDELDWSTSDRRSVADLTKELLDSFAALATIKL